ncbi:MAG: universal stress protein [Ilumatobacteraceae bacterium]
MTESIILGPEETDRAVSTILVGLDGSAASIHATGFAARLAVQLNARIIAAHAVGLLDVWPENPHDRGERNSHKHVSDLSHGAWSDPIRLCGIEPEVVLRDGPPTLVLIDLAEEYDADLVVVGSRGVGQAAVFALGSTAARLTEVSTRPVVVVPEPALRDRADGTPSPTARGVTTRADSISDDGLT